MSDALSPLRGRSLSKRPTKKFQEAVEFQNTRTKKHEFQLYLGQVSSPTFFNNSSNRGSERMLSQ